jgi:hypothetical protein
VGQVGKVLGEDTSLGFKVERAGDGKYQLKGVRPLILAVYEAKPKTRNSLGPNDESLGKADVKETNRVLMQNVQLSVP